MPRVPWEIWLPVLAAALLFGQSSEELNRRGAALFQQRRPAEAAAVFEQSLAANPRQPGIAKLLGLCYELTEENEKAEDAFLRAARLDMKDPETWFFLGRHYYKVNFFDKATEALEKARKLNGRDPRVHTFLGLTFEAAGSLGAAERAYQAAIGWNEKLAAPGFRPHFCYGVLLGKLDRLAESERHLRRAVELEPALWETHFELGKVLYKQGQLEAASRALQAALATQTARGEEAARVYHLLARVYFDMERPDEAAQALRMRESLAP